MSGEIESFDYVTDRLQEQITYYGKKSRENQSAYHRIKVTEIIISVTIPALTAYLKDYECIKYVIVMLGVILAILTSTQIIYKYHEKWIMFRSTSESLKQEKFMYKTSSGPYKINSIGVGSTVADLAERVEVILSKENSTWNQLMSKREEKK